MEIPRVKLSALLFFSIGLIGVYAQEAIPTTGGMASSNNGSVSYSVGQVVCTYVTNSNGLIAAGVQQPYEISVVSTIEGDDINLQYSIYPNPTTGLINLKIEKHGSLQLSYLLYNMDGTLLRNTKLTGDEMTIDMKAMVVGTYFLKVVKRGNEVKIFKIIKR